MKSRTYFGGRTWLIRLGVAVALALQISVPASGEPTASAPLARQQILILSDLHFDPMADQKLVDRLAAAEPEQWRAVLEGSEDTSLGSYGRDSNWMLLRSTFRRMRETLPDPALVLVPGDLLAHGFRREFNAAAGDHSDADYRAFELPILRALGAGDGGPDFDQDWTSYGNYSATVGGLRVLSANTSFFSVRYRNTCGSSGDTNPGQATLAWLEAKLAAAKQARERVWLVYHMPPGIDGYATLRRGACPATIIPMWDQAYAEPFYALLRAMRIPSPPPLPATHIWMISAWSATPMAITPSP